MKTLLDDLRALERMLETGMVESGVHRIGAEQEMFLVDANLGPAAVAEEVRYQTHLPKPVEPAELTAVAANLAGRHTAPLCSPGEGVGGWPLSQ